MPTAGRPRALPDRSETQVQAMLRSCLGRFATGVAVVTFADDQGPHGITVNSFTAVSLRPPLVLASVARSARSHDRLAGRPFTVNVLGAEQERLARSFAGGQPLQVAWIQGAQAPRLPDVLAHLECRPWRHYDGGDHTLYLGEVSDFDYRDGSALGFIAGRFMPIAEPELGLEQLI